MSLVFTQTMAPTMIAIDASFSPTLPLYHPPPSCSPLSSGLLCVPPGSVCGQVSHTAIVLCSRACRQIATRLLGTTLIPPPPFLSFSTYILFSWFLWLPCCLYIYFLSGQVRKIDFFVDDHFPCHSGS